MSVNKYNATTGLLEQIAGSGSEGSFYQTTPVTALSGATSVTIQDSHIHTTSLIVPYADNGTNVPMASPSAMTLTEGQCVLTVDTLADDTEFTLVILSESALGSCDLSDLDDVAITSVSDGQVLAYNGTTQKWVNVDFSGGGHKPHLKVSADASESVTATLGAKVYTLTETSSGIYECDVDDWGTYEIEGVLNGAEVTGELVVDTDKIYNYSFAIPVPEGATVTPTDDIQTWLKCAAINDKNYTSLAEVLNDTDTFTALLQDSNACDYMARSTEWAVQEGLVPVMTSATTPSGTVISSADYSSEYAGWKAFDGNSSTRWNGNNSDSTAYIGYVFTSPTVVNRVVIDPDASGTGGGYFKHGYIEARNSDNESWTRLCEITITVDYEDHTIIDKSFVNENAYSQYRVYCDDSFSSNIYSFYSVQFYADADITNNADAMARVGKYDYCSDALLTNDDWEDAIIASDYWDSILNSSSPAMTSNTTPSGTAFASSAWTGYDAYKSFVRINTGGWCPYDNGNGYIGYDFGKKNPIKYLKHIFANTESNQTFYLQGSDNGSSYTNILTINTGSYKGTWDFYELENEVNYRYYRIYGPYTATNSNCHTQIILMGRKHVSDTYYPLVPVMTSDTTPSGECIGTTSASGYPKYYAFDNNSSTKYVYTNGSTPASDVHIGYHFPTPQVVEAFSFTGNVDSPYLMPTKVRLQGSNDNSTWTDITQDIEFSTADTTKHMVSVTNSTAYAYYRLECATRYYSTNGQYYVQFSEVQFYTKPDIGIIHSAANDTIYYLEDGDPVIVATTGNDGIGEVDWSDFDEGNITLYSTVAKDPSNLSNDYHKSVKITKHIYGGTTEVYLMPDEVKTLYWYGYNNGMEDYTSANGWSNGANTLLTPTKNTNYISHTSSAGQVCGVGTKNTVKASTVKAIVQGVTIDAYNRYGVTTSTVSKTVNDVNFAELKSNNLTLMTMPVTLSTCYITLYAATGGAMNSYALWYE